MAGAILGASLSISGFCAWTVIMLAMVSVKTKTKVARGSFNSHPSFQHLKTVRHIQPGIDIDDVLANVQNETARKLSISISK